MLQIVTMLISAIALVHAAGTIEEYNVASNSSLLWGPYRSNLYLGIRPRIPDSFLSGLFWFNADDYQSIVKSKHTCEQSDDFEKFGWTKYDPRFGGIEEIIDNDNHIELTFEFVKNYDLQDINQQSWGLKVKGKPRPGYENVKTGIVFYAGTEVKNPEVGEGILNTNLLRDPAGFRHSDVVKLTGFTEDLKEFEIEINDGPDSNKHPKVPNLIFPEYDPQFTKHVELNVPENNIWRAQAIFLTMLQESIEELNKKIQSSGNAITLDELPPSVGLTLANIHNYKGNLHFVEKIFEGEFEFDIVFNSLGSKPGFKKITFANIASEIKSAISKFETKFDKVFKFNKPFTGKKFKTFGQDFISNLMGGIGFFHGDHLVDRTTKLDEEDINDGEEKFIKLVGKPEGPFELFTSVPSRPFFPRGFYWDEGFHLIPILEYDFDLALDILKSWFNLIDDEGWIAREQILGEEARTKVPADFQVQNPNIANPPTLMLVFIDVVKKAKEAAAKKSGDRVEAFAAQDLDSPQAVEGFGAISKEDATGSMEKDNVSGFHLDHPELLLDYAKQIYPKLQKHYQWFRDTQRGELEDFDRTPTSMNEAYRWKGRTGKLCLPSGLDDYPRADVVDVGELHVDLMAWMGSFTRSMKQLAELLDYKDDFEKYSQIESDIVHNLDDLHWSEDDKSYCDVTLNYAEEDEFVCHKGYVTLFPFLLKLIPHDSEHILPILQTIADPEQLFSPYGIRSLSKADDYFRTGEDYWRGKIWVNINYLILDSLLYYSKPVENKALDEETFKVAAELYKTLRTNLVKNIFSQYQKTGYAWENYDEANGEPRGVRHFLGWTSLAVMIMKMPETL